MLLSNENLDAKSQRKENMCTKHRFASILPAFLCVLGVFATKNVSMRKISSQNIPIGIGAPVAIIGAKAAKELLAGLGERIAPDRAQTALGNLRGAVDFTAEPIIGPAQFVHCEIFRHKGDMRGVVMAPRHVEQTIFALDHVAEGGAGIGRQHRRANAV